MAITRFPQIPCDSTANLFRKLPKKLCVRLTYSVIYQSVIYIQQENKT